MHALGVGHADHLPKLNLLNDAIAIRINLSHELLHLLTFQHHGGSQEE